MKNNAKNLKFKVGDHVKIPKIKTFWETITLQIGLNTFFLIKKIENKFPCVYVINDLNGEEFVGTFYDKELRKINQTEFTVE